MVTIRPAGAASRSGRAAWQQWNRPSRLTAIMSRQRESVTFANGTPAAAPALLTRRVIGPCASRARAKARSTSSRRVTSAGATRASKLPAQTSSSGSRRRPTRVSFAPSAPSARAMAAPMPVPPPVMIAWWFFSLLTCPPPGASRLSLPPAGRGGVASHHPLSLQGRGRGPPRSGGRVRAVSRLELRFPREVARQLRHSAEILGRHVHPPIIVGGGGAKGPHRVDEVGTGQRHQIRPAGGEDRVDVVGLVDVADRD